MLPLVLILSCVFLLSLPVVKFLLLLLSLVAISSCFLLLFPRVVILLFPLVAIYSCLLLFLFPRVAISSSWLFHPTGCFILLFILLLMSRCRHRQAVHERPVHSERRGKLSNSRRRVPLVSHPEQNRPSCSIQSFLQYVPKKNFYLFLICLGNVNVSFLRPFPLHLPACCQPVNLRDEDAVGHLALDDESVGLFFDLRSQVRHGRNINILAGLSYRRRCSLLVRACFAVPL